MVGEPDAILLQPCHQTSGIMYQLNVVNQETQSVVIAWDINIKGLPTKGIKERRCCIVLTRSIGYLISLHGLRLACLRKWISTPD